MRDLVWETIREMICEFISGPVRFVLKLFGIELPEINKDKKEDKDE